MKSVLNLINHTYMTTVIVPVDFSSTSLHAARYAANLLVGHYGVTLLLYHSYSGNQRRMKPKRIEETCRKN